MKTTPLTEQFDYDAFQSHYRGSVVCLFLINQAGVLTVCTADDGPTPRAGQTLVSLVDPVEPPAEEASDG